MSKVVKNERYVPLKNYVIAFLIVCAIILITWYGFAWYNVFKENEVSTSYLVKEKIISNEIKSLNELEDVFLEAPSTYFVYVSYTGSKEVYNMEKDIKDLIIDYNLNDSMYFFNTTLIKDNENYIEEINDALKLKDKKITKVPTIIYYKDSEVVDLISRNDSNIMNMGDFQKLLDRNNLTKE